MDLYIYIYIILFTGLYEVQYGHPHSVRQCVAVRLCEAVYVVPA